MCQGRCNGQPVRLPGTPRSLTNLIVLVFLQELESSTEPHKLLNETTQVPELHQKQPQATSQSLSTSPQDAGSSALIHKLLESLEALGKVQGAPVAPSILRDSGSTEDSAVDGLEHGPNSPTGVINQLDHRSVLIFTHNHLCMHYETL